MNHSPNVDRSPDPDRRDRVRTQVVACLATIAPEVDVGALTDDTSLRDELDLDSMDFLNFVQRLHDEMGVDVPERDYPHLVTLGSTVDHLVAITSG